VVGRILRGQMTATSGDAIGSIATCSVAAGVDYGAG
jgi:hypothetical protein